MIWKIKHLLTAVQYDFQPNEFFMKKSVDNLMKGFPPSLDDQVRACNWRTPRRARWSFNHVRHLLPTAPIFPSNKPINLFTKRKNLNRITFVDSQNKQVYLEQFLRMSNTDAFAVLHKGSLVFDWFDGFGSLNQPHIIFSITKSLAALLVGVLIDQGMLNRECSLTEYLPELIGSAYEGAQLKHLLDMQVASDFEENYLDSDGIFLAYRRAASWAPVEEGVETEGLRNFLRQLPKNDSVAHGTMHHYCSPHSDVLGWIIERVGKDSFSNQFSKFISRPCGLKNDAYITLDTYGAPRVSGGICMSLHDLLLIGEMVRNRGEIFGTQVVPSVWIDDFMVKRENSIWLKQKYNTGPRLFKQGNYRSLWYQTGFADQEVCAIGIHGQWLWINPKKELVIVKLASHGKEIDTVTDQRMILAFSAISDEFG